MNLYELTAVYQRLQNEIENGEDYDGILEVIDDELEQKADGYARVIRNMEAQASAFKEEEKRIAEKRKRMEAGIERLKGNLYESMKAIGKYEIPNDLFTIKIVTNGGTIPVIVDVPTEKLPDDLVQITEKPDLKAIAEYIKETGDITYAHFGERGESLRIK